VVQELSSSHRCLTLTFEPVTLKTPSVSSKAGNGWLWYRPSQGRVQRVHPQDENWNCWA